MLNGTRRQSNKLNRFIRNAHFAIPSATVEGIEYHEDRKLDKAQMLRFATCKYIDEGHHIILKGASGNGKTYIACAMGNAACRRFKKVQYVRMPELLDELSIARSGGTLKKVLESYKKKDPADSGRVADPPAVPHRNPTIFWKLWKRAATSLRSFARSMNLKVGIPELIPTRNPTAPFLKLLWTVLSTTLTRFWWTATFPCGSAKA